MQNIELPEIDPRGLGWIRRIINNCKCGKKQIYWAKYDKEKNAFVPIDRMAVHLIQMTQINADMVVDLDFCFICDMITLDSNEWVIE